MKKYLSLFFFVSIIFCSVFAFANENWQFYNYDEYCFIQSSPIKTDKIAGGASLAPSLKSLLALAMHARRSSSCSKTADIVFIKNVKNCRLLIGVFPGLKRFTPVLVAKDQLLCFPDPLIPSKGFS